MQLIQLRLVKNAECENCGMLKVDLHLRKLERKLNVVGKQISDTKNTIKSNFPYL